MPATTSATMPGRSSQWITRSRPSGTIRSTPRTSAIGPYSTGLRSVDTMRRTPFMEEIRFLRSPLGDELAPVQKSRPDRREISTSSTWLLASSIVTPEAASVRSRTLRW